MGATVVLACRDESRAQSAVSRLVQELCPNEGATSSGQSIRDRLPIILLDLASFQSVRDFVVKFKERFHRLDILIANAGIACMS